MQVLVPRGIFAPCSSAERPVGEPVRGPERGNPERVSRCHINCFAVLTTGMHRLRFPCQHGPDNAAGRPKRCRVDNKPANGALPASTRQKSQPAPLLLPRRPTSCPTSCPTLHTPHPTARPHSALLLSQCLTPDGCRAEAGLRPHLPARMKSGCLIDENRW